MTVKDPTYTKKVALTARAIEKMKPETFLVDIGENEGLRVNKGKTGLTSFSYRFRSPIDNSLKKVKIGTYPDMSLAEARVELQKMKIKRRAGICPSQELKDQKEQKKIEQEKRDETNAQFTVKELIDLYLTNVIEDRYVLDSKTGTKKLILGARKRKGQDEARRTLYGDAVRVLGHIAADQVTRKDVVNMISKIIERGANVQAGRVLAELTLAYDYSIGLEKFKDDFANPALLAKSSLKQSRVKLTHKKGSRVLSDKEIKKVLEWLPTSGFSEKLRHIIRITLWTGCRTGEVCELKWADIDFEKNTWHLKGSKNGTDRYVQLSKQCLEYIKALSRESDFLFESRIKGRPITQKILTVYKWQMRHPEKLSYALQPEQLWLSEIEDWSPHDLRRTVRTGLSRLSCPAEIAEAVLGHSKKGIQGTYNLHAYEKECAEWLQKWADHLDAL